MKAYSVSANSAVNMQALRGFSIENASGAVAASFRLRKVNASGQILFTINLAAAESVTLMFPTALLVDGATYVEVDSGSIAGSLFGTDA